MRILQINEKNLTGGAACSMRRLHAGLKQAGVSPHMLVGRLQGRPSPDCSVLPRLSIANRIPFHALNLIGLNFAGMTGMRHLAAHPRFLDADVIQLQNLHGGYFNYRWLPALSRMKPLVWTFRDMWPLTGHCSHSFDCRRWLTGCGRCPYPKTYPAIRRDATAWEWRLKKDAYAASDVVAVCPSRWLTALARESPLIPFPVHHINNGIDTDVFRPLDRSATRQALGMPQNKTTLVFVADNLRNPFKDFGLLVAALQGMDPTERSRCVLLLLGDVGRDPVSFPGFEVIACGYVEDDTRKAQLLSTADFMAFPTKADNQPLVVIEAMACGCPVISTAVGGVPELVLHDKTGILVDTPSPDAFRAAIRALLDAPDRRISLGAQARDLILREHSLRSCTRQYLDLYQETLARRHDLTRRAKE